MRNVAAWPATVTRGEVDSGCEVAVSDPDARALQNLGWIKCMLGLAVMSVRRKRARKKKRKPGVDATVLYDGVKPSSVYVAGNSPRRSTTSRRL